MIKNPPKLVVVDDEEDLAEFVSDVAEALDFDAKYTSRPQDFGHYYSNDVAVFIFDLFMPGVDGIELLRFLAENKSNASVIFMSGKDKSVLRAAQELAIALNIAVLGSIQKPFRAIELEEILLKYSPSKIAPSVSQRYIPTDDDLRHAMDNDEFHLVYQPQVRIDDSSVVGVEALIRWQHPIHGYISPDIFIPLAEDHGQIHEITWYVARTALNQAGAWRAAGLDIRLSINMSPKTFEDLDLPEKLAAMVQIAGALIRNVTIEVTETGLMVDIARYIDVLTRLKMKGFGLSIDDFGTGYSSLLQLIRVSFNELKIDQTFIKNLVSDNECQIITEISSMLAHKLNMHVVAEGIEDEDTWNRLKDMGCEEAQGYWISKPLIARDLIPWMREWALRTDSHDLMMQAKTFNQPDLRASVA